MKAKMKAKMKAETIAKTIAAFVFIWLVVNVRTNRFHISPDFIFNDVLHQSSKTSLGMIEQKGDGYAEYICKVDNGVLVVCAERAGMIFWKCTSNYITTDPITNADAEYKDVYYDRISHSNERSLHIFGLCKKKGTLKVRVVHEQKGITDYPVKNDLFLVEIDQDARNDMKLYGIDKNDEVLWKMDY